MFVSFFVFVFVFVFVFFFVFVFVFVFVFLRGGWCPQVLLEPPSVTGGTKHIETVQTAATASKVYIWKTFERRHLENTQNLKFENIQPK